jgi:hypothetical protein
MIINGGGFHCSASLVKKYSEESIEEEVKKVNCLQLFNNDEEGVAMQIVNPVYMMTNTHGCKRDLIARCKQMKLPERIRELIEEKNLKNLRQVSNGWLTMAVFLFLIVEVGLGLGVIKVGVKIGWDASLWQALGQLQAVAISGFVIFGLFPVALMRFVYNRSVKQDTFAMTKLMDGVKSDLETLKKAREGEGFETLPEWRRKNIDDAIEFLTHFLGFDPLEEATLDVS